MKPLHLIAAAFVAAGPALAQPSAPVPDALLDELLSALPHQEEWVIGTDPDQAEVARIAVLNPGREKEVRAILADHARCVAPAIAAATRRAIRTVGRNLGADKLRQLIAFYRSDDVRRLDAIDAQVQKTKAATPAQEEEMGRIMAAHPVLAEFGTAIQGSGAIIAQDEALASAAGQCAGARAAAFGKAKLRLN